MCVEFLGVVYGGSVCGVSFREKEGECEETDGVCSSCSLTATLPPLFKLSLTDGLRFVSGLFVLIDLFTLASEGRLAATLTSGPPTVDMKQRVTAPTSICCTRPLVCIHTHPAPCP